MAKTFRRFVLLIGAAFAAGALPGCGGEEHASTEETAPGLVADFTVRGRVMQMPDPGSPGREFRVHHEPIPEWKKNYREAPVGMNAMVMPFPPASPEVIEGLAVGDVVALTFRAEYDEETGGLKGYRATRVEKLPAGTALAFDADE